MNASWAFTFSKYKSPSRHSFSNCVHFDTSWYKLSISCSYIPSLSSGSKLSGTKPSSLPRHTRMYSWQRRISSSNSKKASRSKDSSTWNWSIFCFASSPRLYVSQARRTRSTSCKYSFRSCRCSCKIASFFSRSSKEDCHV